MINPYQPLESASGAPASPPELSRAVLARLLRQVLDGRLDGTEFDHELNSHQLGTDPILPIFIDQLLDVCVDSTALEKNGRTSIQLNKRDWDYLQRLLLLLEADCQLETHSERYWSSTQLVAAGAIIGLAVVTSIWGWNGLAWVWIPCGLLSMCLEWILSRTTRSRSAYQSIIEPFASIGDLRTAYESTRFTKQKYRGPTPARHADPNYLPMAIGYLLIGVFWLALGPIILAIQIAPRTAVTIQARPHPSDNSPFSPPVTTTG
ncbi:MAG: hypothetical protein U0795_09880 [Pirellulales bacterium]